MNTYTDNQLKAALAKMLPDEIKMENGALKWRGSFYQTIPSVRNTELLHVCWLIEQTLTEKEDVWFLQKLSQQRYMDGERGTIGTLIDRSTHATWQQRTIALAKVKGIEL